MDDLIAACDARKGEIIHYIRGNINNAHIISPNKISEYTYRFLQEVSRDPEELCMCYLIMKIANGFYIIRNIPGHKHDDLSQHIEKFRMFDDNQKAWCEYFVDEYFRTDYSHLMHEYLPFGTQKS